MGARRYTPVHVDWINQIDLQRMVPIPGVAVSLAVRIPGLEATMRDPPTRIDWQFTSTNFVTQGDACPAWPWSRASLLRRTFQDELYGSAWRRQ